MSPHAKYTHRLKSSFFRFHAVMMLPRGGEQVKKCKDLASVAEEEEQQAAKDKKAGVVQRAPSYPNKRPRPPAAVAQKERAKHAPLGADFPLEKMVRVRMRVRARRRSCWVFSGRLALMRARVCSFSALGIAWSVSPDSLGWRRRF